MSDFVLILGVLLASLTALGYVVGALIHCVENVQDFDAQKTLEMDRPTYVVFCLYQAIFWPAWAFQYLRRGAAGLRNYKIKENPDGRSLD